MNGKVVKDRLIGDSWFRVATFLAIGLLGGGGATTGLLAQPRTDAEIRNIAKQEVDSKHEVVQVELKNIKEDVKEVKGDVKEILRRLPK